MAINTSNSNYVNINNLPQTQEALDGDLLLLQTENGTQTIDFKNFNVVKTDAEGNATVVGDLSGGYVDINNLTVSSVSAASYFINGTQGYTAPNDYYNKFTVSNGLITNASYVVGSDEYLNITTTVLRNLTAYTNTVYKRVIDVACDGTTYTAITIPPGDSFKVATINNFYKENNPGYGIASDALKTWHIQFWSLDGLPGAVTTSLSGVPWASAAADSTNTTLTKSGDSLTFRVNLGYKNTSENLNLYWRILYTY
jgi:hypothetical protein